MRPVNKTLRTALLSATLAMALPGVAFAGKASQAQAAIAEARGKISAGNIAGTATEANSLQMQAKAELTKAEIAAVEGQEGRSHRLCEGRACFDQARFASGSNVWPQHDNYCRRCCCFQISAGSAASVAHFGCLGEPAPSG